MIVVNLDGMPENSTVQPPKVMQQIVASGASLWVVSYQNSVSMPTVAKAGHRGQNLDLVLSRAQGTGGVRLKVGDVKVLETALLQIAAAVAGQYEVTYTRPDGPLPVLLQMAQVRSGVNLIYPQTPPK
jgi:hypothetical protein